MATKGLDRILSPGSRAGAEVDGVEVEEAESKVETEADAVTQAAGERRREV